MNEEAIQRWVNTGGVVIAALALALGTWTVACGPDSIRGRITEMRIQEGRVACAEGLVTVSALAAEIHNPQVADDRKNAFRVFRSGKLHLVKDDSVKALFEQVWSSYQPEDTQTGVYAPGANVDSLYPILEAHLDTLARRIAERCNHIGTDRRSTPDTPRLPNRFGDTTGVRARSEQP